MVESKVGSDALGNDLAALSYYDIVNSEGFI